MGNQKQTSIRGNFPGGTKQETLNVLTPLSLQSALLLGIGGTCNVNHPSPPSCLFTASTGKAHLQKLLFINDSLQQQLS